jgi:hypothetical protein
LRILILQRKGRYRPAFVGHIAPGAQAGSGLVVADGLRVATAIRFEALIAAICQIRWASSWASKWRAAWS